MSNGSLTRYDFAIQSGYEQIPGPGDAWEKFRFNGGGPNRSTTTEEDPEIGGDTGSVTSEGPATGTFDISMWYGQIDKPLEQAFGSTFGATTPDVLEPGSDLIYATFQEHQPDLLSGDKFTQFVNGAVTSFTLTLPTPNGRITGQVGYSFSNGASSAVSIASAAPTVNTSPLMRTGSLITDLEIDDTPVSALNQRVSQLVMNFTRETSDEPQIDLDGRGAITLGDFRCELGFTTYDEDRTIVNTMFVNQSRKVAFKVRDTNTQGYDFLLPVVSPNGGEVSPAAKNTGRTQTLPYATQDMTITRIT